MNASIAACFESDDYREGVKAFIADLKGWTDSVKALLLQDAMIEDATPTQRSIKEGNVGIYMFRIEDLLWVLPKISNKNKKGE